MEQSLKGKILRGVGGFYSVLSDDGKVYVCKARGLFRKLGVVPLPGDNVVFSVNVKGEGYLMEILERYNELIRPAVANIDALMIVVSANDPIPDFDLVDKLLIFCRIKSITPILVINKCDSGVNETVRTIVREYDKALESIIPVSAETGYGLENLSAYMCGNTVCLAGQSAVGKSSLINKLLGLELKTGELSAKTDRGRHTTRHAELIETPFGGTIVDTPGFSMLDSLPLEPERIPDLYPEFSEQKGACRFLGCMHLSEPDCVIKQMVDKGEISLGRYTRYVKIMKEALEARRHKYD